MSALNLDEIRARARSAARYGREGFFVTSLLEVAEEDVPALLAEVERLRAVAQGMAEDWAGSRDVVLASAGRALLAALGGAR